MKIYVDGLILKEKLKHLLDEHKNFKSDLSLKELSDFLEKYQIDKPVEDRYDRSRKFIDWNNDKEGWPHEYLALVLIDDLDDFTYVFDMPPVTEVHRDHDIHYEPDYMLADETVGPEEDEPVKLDCASCVHYGHWDQCTECDRDHKDFKAKSCLTCKNEECDKCVGYSKYEYNHVLEELEEDEEEEKVIELTLNDIASILQGETINGVKLIVKLKKEWDDETAQKVQDIW